MDKNREEMDKNREEMNKKEWQKMTNAERQESVNRYKKGLIAYAMLTKKDDLFWNKELKAKDIEKTMPYNKYNGKPFQGLTGVLLRAFSQANNYKTNEFISLTQAWSLGGELKYKTTLDKQGNSQKVAPQAFKYEYLADYTIQPKIDPKTNEPMKAISENGREYIVKEKVYHQTPKLETITLYHISEFKNLNQDKLKSLDKDLIAKHREELANQKSDTLPNLEKIGIKGLVANTIERFLEAQNKGKDYIPSQTLVNVLEKSKEEKSIAKSEEKSKGRTM